jgi:hypothetical protein
VREAIAVPTRDVASGRIAERDNRARGGLTYERNPRRQSSRDIDDNVVVT